MSKEVILTGDLIIIKSERPLKSSDLICYRNDFLCQREEGIIVLPDFFSYSVHPQANIQILKEEKGDIE